MSVLDDLAEAAASVTEFTQLQVDQVTAAVEPAIEDFDRLIDIVGSSAGEPGRSLVGIVDETDELGRLEDVFEVMFGLPTQVIEVDTIESIRDFQDIGPDTYRTLYTEIQGSATEDLILVLILIEVLNKIDEDLIDPIEEF
jgi:hypothetical protein